MTEQIFSRKTFQATYPKGIPSDEVEKPQGSSAKGIHQVANPKVLKIE
jgi:hypothetical protein